MKKRGLKKRIYSDQGPLDNLPVPVQAVIAIWFIAGELASRRFIFFHVFSFLIFSVFCLIWNLIPSDISYRSWMWSGIWFVISAGVWLGIIPLAICVRHNLKGYKQTHGK